MTLLDVKNLKVSYKTYRGILKVLDGINLRIEKGEKIGIIGESGAGKTTTVKAIMRTLPNNAIIEEGEIIYNGRDLLRMDEKTFNLIRRRKFAMIFQDPTASLNPVFKVGQQLVDILKYSKEENRDYDELKEEILQAFKEVMLPDPERVFNSYPFQLSGGMRQRVCIAIALATAQELLIADEPTTNLDVTIQDQILRLIKDLVNKKNLSVILISHALGAVRSMVDRVYVMYAGTIVESAKADELFKRPKHPYTVALLRSVPRLTGGGVSQGIKGEMPDYLHPPQGCRFHPRCDYRRDICASKRPPATHIGDHCEVFCHLFSSY